MNVLIEQIVFQLKVEGSALIYYFDLNLITKAMH
mgnify:FL=1